MTIGQTTNRWTQALLLFVPTIAVGLGYASTSAPVIPDGAALDLSVHTLDAAVEPTQQIRQVNPSVEHISSWISSVGASAAIADLDGDALANDVCIVDPRSDSAAIVQVSSSPEATLRPDVVLVDQDGIAGDGGGESLSYDAGRNAPMGCRLADVTEDGWTDVLVYFWGRAPVMFVNGGDWSFAARELLGPDGASFDWYSNTALFSDLNGDGHIDIFLGNYFADGSQLLDRDSDRQVAMNDSLSKAFNGGGNVVLLNQGGYPEHEFELVEGVFDDPTSEGWTLAAAAADFDGDLLPELYVANDFGPDRFFGNSSAGGALQLLSGDGGNKGLISPRSTVLGRDSFKGMGVTIADVDRDLDYDIYVSNITSPYGLFESQLLYLNDGPGPSGEAPNFQYDSEDLGVARTAFAWDNKVADLDNDGQVELLQATGFIRGSVDRWPEVQELALSNDALIHDPRVWPDLTDADVSGDAPRVVLKRLDDDRFANVADASGLDDTGVTKGIALSDIDGDGDLDWIEANQWADSRLIVNECDGCGSFLGLRLLHEDSTSAGQVEVEVVDGLEPQQERRSSPAIGATAVVTMPDGSAARAFVDGGNGHSGQSNSDLHFGLGDGEAPVYSVSLAWRSSEGDVQQASVNVGPGWNTVYLPW